jgi:hypothetical protein
MRSNIDQSQSVDHGDDIDSLIQNIISGDDVFHKLEANKSLLENIICQNPVDVNVDQAWRDFRREKVLFNDVLFVPDCTNPPSFPNALKILVQRLQKAYPSSFDTAINIVDTILTRACRTSAGADSYFKVNRMFSGQNTILRQHTDSIDVPIDTIDIPIKVDFFCLKDDLCARIEVNNTYALHKLDKDEEVNTIPWLLIDTTVIDETNFKTLENSRKLRVTVLDLQQRPFSCAVKQKKYIKFPYKLPILSILSFKTMR